MLRSIIYIFVGFMSGYIFITLTPINHSENMASILLSFIVDPLQFFTAMVCFFTGYLANSVLLKNMIEQMLRLFKGMIVNWPNILYSGACMVNFYLFFQIGFWHSIVLLLFTIVYAIISIDIKEENKKRLNQ
jgi:hypothetical protein